MKKLFILTVLTLNACTTVRRDDHSYTYIHNFNSYSGEKPSAQIKMSKEDKYPSGDFPEYNGGMGQSSAVIEDAVPSENKTSKKITNNHYYYSSYRVASYNPPPPYSGYAPSLRRYLIQGEIR